MKRIIVVMIMLFLTFNIKSQSKKEVYKKDNYSIEYNNDWELDLSGQMNSSFILFSKIEPNDTFRENVNLLIQDLKGLNMTMESYVDLSESQIKTMIPNSKLIESKVVDSYYSMVWSGVVGGTELKFKQYFFVKEKEEKAYVLTLTTLPNTYDKYVEVGSKILNSFKLK
tara:strand:+ start:38327 stop:38833 length:507 start_codon:yes stop_codon:yes gene_type:complete